MAKDPSDLSIEVVDGPGDVPDNDDGMIVVACVSPTNNSPFTDNVKTNCRMCGAPIIHRPHLPEKGVPHCLACAQAIFQEEREAGEETKIFVTRRTVDEVLEYLDSEKKRRLS